MATHLFRPTYQVEAIINRLRGVLENGWTGRGPLCEEFEKEVLNYLGVPGYKALYVSSCTAALHLAVASLGLKPGARVVTTPLTFIATNDVLLYEQLEPIFVDVDPETLCLSSNALKEYISFADAVMVVHYGGTPARMDEIWDLCGKKGVPVIEDAAHAMGGRYLDGRHVGAGNSYATCYSYHAVKNLPTADSGMLVMSDKDKFEKAKRMSWFGIDRSTYERTVDKGGMYRWKYDVVGLGWKYNGNDVMAAIALEQLKVLDGENARRREIFARYRRNLGDIRLVAADYNVWSSRHLCVIRVKNRDKLIMKLNENDIYPGVHYRLTTDYPMYGRYLKKCPEAERAANEIVSLPMHIGLMDEDIDKISEVILNYVKA